MRVQELFCDTRTQEVCPVVFCPSRFQAVPLPGLGLLVPLQHLEAAWAVSEIQSSATKSSGVDDLNVCLWSAAHKFPQPLFSSRDWCRKLQHSILLFFFFFF